MPSKKTVRAGIFPEDCQGRKKTGQEFLESQQETNYPGYRVRKRRLQGRNALPLLIYPAEKKRMRKIQVYSHHAMLALHTPSGSSPLSNQTQTPNKSREGDYQLIFGKIEEAAASLVPAIRDFDSGWVFSLCFLRLGEYIYQFYNGGLPASGPLRGTAGPHVFRHFLF